MGICVHMSGGQSSHSDVISHSALHLLFETGSLTLTAYRLILLDWLVNGPRVLSVSISPTLGLHVNPTDHSF